MNNGNSILLLYGVDIIARGQLQVITVYNVKNIEILRTEHDFDIVKFTSMFIGGYFMMHNI